MWTIVAYVSLFVTFLLLSAFVILAISISIDQHRMRTANKILPTDKQALKNLKPMLSMRRNQIGLAIGLSLVAIGFGCTWYFFTLASLVS